MANWRDSIPSKNLRASDLDGGPRLVTISHFTVEKVGEEKEERPCVWFEGETKGLILNVGNGNEIEAICGSSDPEDWRGRQIVIYATETDYKGKRVPCIRVRAAKRQAAPAPAQRPASRPAPAPAPHIEEDAPPPDDNDSLPF